jgi:hypothetical protein
MLTAPGSEAVDGVDESGPDDAETEDAPATSYALKLFATCAGKQTTRGDTISPNVYAGGAYYLASPSPTADDIAAAPWYRRAYAVDPAHSSRKRRLLMYRQSFWVRLSQTASDNVIPANGSKRISMSCKSGYSALFARPLLAEITPTTWSGSPFARLGDAAYVSDPSALTVTGMEPTGDGFDFVIANRSNADVTLLKDGFLNTSLYCVNRFTAKQRSV